MTLLCENKNNPFRKKFILKKKAQSERINPAPKKNIEQSWVNVVPTNEIIDMATFAMIHQYPAEKNYGNNTHILDELPNTVMKDATAAQIDGFCEAIW